MKRYAWVESAVSSAEDMPVPPINEASESISRNCFEL
jgi:hypothetical protein